VPKKRADPQNQRKIHIRLSEEVHRRLRIRAAELDTTIQEWVAALIDKELSQRKKRG